MHHHHNHHHGENQHEHHHHGEDQHGHNHDHGSSGKKWQELNPNYASMDSAPQTFFYTLSNLMKFQESKNILQVGCGAGKLLSTVLDLKATNTRYNATDISQGMVKQSERRLRAHFQKYKSQLTFEEWLKEQNFTFSVQNGQCVTSPKQKYDRIISNMVICHSKDPYKMLKNWHQISTEDCILGASLAGNPDRNPFVKLIRQSHQTNEKSEDLPPWHWYDKILDIADQAGWEIILHWEQNALFPSLNPYDQHLTSFFSKRVPPKAQDVVKEAVEKIFKEQKSGIQFWCLAFVAKKKPAI